MAKIRCSTLYFGFLLVTVLVRSSATVTGSIPNTIPKNAQQSVPLEDCKRQTTCETCRGKGCMWCETSCVEDTMFACPVESQQTSVGLDGAQWLCPFTPSYERPPEGTDVCIAMLQLSLSGSFRALGAPQVSGQWVKLKHKKKWRTLWCDYVQHELHCFKDALAVGATPNVIVSLSMFSLVRKSLARTAKSGEIELVDVTNEKTKRIRPKTNTKLNRVRLSRSLALASTWTTCVTVLSSLDSDKVTTYETHVVNVSTAAYYSQTNQQVLAATAWKEAAVSFPLNPVMEFSVGWAQTMAGIEALLMSPRVSMQADVSLLVAAAQILSPLLTETQSAKLVRDVNVDVVTIVGNLNTDANASDSDANGSGETTATRLAAFETAVAARATSVPSVLLAEIGCIPEIHLTGMVDSNCTQLSILELKISLYVTLPISTGATCSPENQFKYACDHDS